MRITDVLKPEQVKMFLLGKTKEELFDELVDLASPDATADERAEALTAVHEREAMASTGVGEGVAIPHGMIDGLDNLVAAFGLTEQPVEYDAIDHLPVRLVFFILAPGGQPQRYMRFLARVSRLLNNRDLRQRLLACADAGQVYREFVEYEDAHF